MSDAAPLAVAVIGGGVIGLTTAFELSELGAHCTLVDPAPGRGASWAAAGMLSPAAEIAPGEEPLLDDLREAARIWPAFAARLSAASGVEMGFEKSSSVLVGVSPSDVRDVARTARMLLDAGAKIEPLTASDLQAMEPSLAGGVHGGWLLPQDDRVDNRLFVGALLEALKARGVSLIEDRCLQVSVAAEGVELALEHHGSVKADRCVLATGAAPLPTGLEGLGIPRVRPVRGTTLRLSPATGVAVPRRTVRAVVRGAHCYLVPREDGSLVIGATAEERGFELVSPSGGVFRLLEAAREIFPGVDELPFEEASVGLRPASEDHVPFVASLSDARFTAALGHYRNGILLAPLAGARAARLANA